MVGYYITTVLEFPLWDSRGRKMNRTVIGKLIEEISVGLKESSSDLDLHRNLSPFQTREFDRVEIVKPKEEKSIQFIYWKKEGT